MNTLYNPCPCESGNKFKFCCLDAIKTGKNTHLETRIKKFPALCFAGDNYEKIGMTSVIIARKIFDDNYVVGCYLVDLWCRGVKDAILHLNVTNQELKNLIDKLSYHEKTTNYSYEHTRSLILGSIAYAANIGIAPHQDWNRTKFLIEPHRPFKDSITFGHNGKPLYIAGPYDQEIL